MTRALLYFLACACALIGCNTQRVICPAYQSAFIFDKPTQKETFVFYNENKNQPREILASNNKTLTLPARDSSWERSVVMPGPSLPPERRVRKDRYLLLPKRTYRQALKALQTVSMKPVYPKKEDDSLDIRKALDSAARSVTDTMKATASSKPKESEDSVYVISKEKEKFNLDQDNYMWYFRDILVLPDVRLAMNESKEESNVKGSTATEKKSKQGFFKKLKGLFKKKPKQEIDSTQVKSVAPDQFEEYDSTAVQPSQARSAVTTTPSAPVPSKKKGGGLFKKKAKAKTQPIAPEKKQDPKKDAKKEDDGF